MILQALKSLVLGQKEEELPPTCVVQEDEDDDIDDEDYLEFVGDEVWEDNPAVNKIRARLPGWHIIKVVNFTENTLRDVRDWCSGNCDDEYEHIGFYSGCSYTVGVAFKGHTDAVIFKLTWGTK